METARTPDKIGGQHYLGIFLLSLATLLLELSLTRVLSVALWYHFGFLVISTALLGFGTSGVVLASVYMIRMYQRAMHNRLGPGAESRELSRLDFGLIAPLVAVIVFLGVYPQFVLQRSERSTVSQLHPEVSVIAGRSP